MNRRVTTYFALCSFAVALLLVATAATAEAKGRGDGPVIYLTSQDLYYDSIVTAERLPPKGPFQLREMADVTDGASQTLIVGERGIVFDGVNTHGWWTWGAATTIATTQPFRAGGCFPRNGARPASAFRPGWAKRFVGAQVRRTLKNTGDSILLAPNKIRPFPGPLV